MRRSSLAILTALALLVAPAAAGATVPSQSPSEPEAAQVSVVAAPDDAIAERARSIVAGMPVRARAETVVMGHIPSSDPSTLAEYMRATPMGGFILMGSNVPDSASELRALTHALTVDSALPPLIAVDQEGGDVSRLDGDDFASALTLKDKPAEATRSAFAARAALVQRAGMSVNFGIVADVASDGDGFIFRRALGTAPATAAALTKAAVLGERGEVFSTLKHFPGHGAAGGDSHTSIPTTGKSLATWRQTDALPFAAGIDAGAELLMFGHLAYSAVDTAPASLSRRWHEIARNDLGFAGVIITDDLGMLQASGQKRYRDPVQNAVRAIAAGNDMVLAVALTDEDSAAEMVSGIETATREGTITGARLEEAATRVVELRLRVAAHGPGLRPCSSCASAVG